MSTNLTVERVNKDLRSKGWHVSKGWFGRTVESNYGYTLHYTIDGQRQKMWFAKLENLHAYAQQEPTAVPTRAALAGREG